MLINAFIVGAQKAGTTSLYDWLSQHPDVSAPLEMKDFHYFTEHFGENIDTLHKHYKESKSVKLHCAVNYLFFSETVATKLKNYNPNSKIIICLRNPIDRAISAYKYFRKTCRESYSLYDALNRELL